MTTRTFLKTLCLVPIGALFGASNIGKAKCINLTGEQSPEIHMSKKIYAIDAAYGNGCVIIARILSIDGKRNLVFSRRQFEAWGETMEFKLIK